MERRRAPAPPRYGRRRFWDELYRQQGAETREWLGGLSRFLPQLEPELRPEDRILVLGCGNSALSHDLHELGYTDVTSIDFSPACIAAMRARHARCPGLRWAVMDIRALAFPDASFDVVLEKGTLDVLMVEETDPWHVSPQAAAAMHRVLAEVSRVLRPGGCFISITFAQPHFRKPHYAQEAFGWSLRHAACGDGDAGAFHYFLYVMRKGQPLEPRDAALGRRLHQPPPAPRPAAAPRPPGRRRGLSPRHPAVTQGLSHLPPPNKALRCSILTGGRQGTGASPCKLPSDVGNGRKEGDTQPPAGGTGMLCAPSLAFPC